MTTDSIISVSAGPRCEDALISAAGKGDRAKIGCCKHISLIAQKEFGDRFRSGWVIACVLVWLGAIGLMSFLGLLQIGHIGAQGFERTVISLLNLVQYLVPLLGLLLGHDLIVNEREEGTMRLLLTRGVSRTRFLFGKFVGGCLTLIVPLVLGFAIAGSVVGIAAKDSGIAPFLRLAVSGLVLGVVFVGVGLALSAFCRTRVQSLVAVLLTWCVAVFVFDLAALGLLVSTRSPVAAQEIEVLCDTTHINVTTDIHSAFDKIDDGPAAAAALGRTTSLGWLAINPVDLFRAINLSDQMELQVPALTMLLAVSFWLTLTLGASLWKISRMDL